MLNEPLKIYRADISEWYGIKERALRNRMQKADIQIKNRVLTITDIKCIIDKLGIPPNIPQVLYKTIITT
jgi:hypothetical protein